MNEVQISPEKLANLLQEFDSIVHDLKTPLSLCLWGLSSLEKTNPTEKQQKFLEACLRSMDMSKEILKSYEFIFKNPVCDIFTTDELIQTVKGLFEIKLARSNIKIHQNSLSSYEVCFPKTLASRALGNLIMNASESIAASPRKQGVISLSVSKHIEHAVICVSDDGIGLSPEVAQSLFKTKTSTKTDTEQHGIGLYGMKTSLNKEGADLRYKASEGPGACFELCIPLSTALRKAT